MGTGNQSLQISAGTVQVDRSTLLAPVSATGGAVEVSHGTIDTGDASITFISKCSNASFAIHDSTLHGGFGAQDCAVTLERDHIDTLPTAITLNGSAVDLVENNTITSTRSTTDALSVAGGTGTKVRFNTFVNFSGVDMTAQVLTCGANVDVTSNIFAWHSSMPVACATRYSLFDATAGLQPGTGNIVGDVSTFFSDIANRDLHLAPASPARAAAEPGTGVTTDIEGNVRPQPSGSAPDIGAYEAP